DIASTLEQIDENVTAFDEPDPTQPSESIELNSSSSEATDSTPNELAEADPLPQVQAVTPQSRTMAHHRHWRRRNIALEFAPGEAVSVTRRLFRSGESEFLLTDRSCRLRDIQDLFSGTGLAGGHYAIIEQGRIGQILSAKPMDRRTIIEEAAGITKFRVRQRAAEARLESARSNLSRVADIISEIERQVNSLRRQAAKARRYRILREELRERVYHEEQMEGLAKRRTEIEKEVESVSARLVVIDSELERLRGIEAQLTSENEQMTAALRAAEESHAQKLALVADAENEIESARAELLRHTAAAERLHELARQLENSLEKLSQQADGLAREGERAAAAHNERKT